MKKKIFLFVLIIILIFCLIFLYNNKTTVAVIGAMDEEIEAILVNLTNKHYKQQCDFKIITGNLGNYKLVLSKSGIGKVNSAITTQFIIDKYHPKYIINTGIAGSLTQNLKAGDTIIAEKMVQHDFDLTAFGKPKGYIDSSTEQDNLTIYYSDKNLVNKFSNSSQNNVKKGMIATGDIFVTDIKLKNSIKNEFNADAIDMESSAIAQTAKRNNIPVIVIRTISDGINGSVSEYKQNKQDTAQKSALNIINMLKTHFF